MSILIDLTKTQIVVDGNSLVGWQGSKLSDKLAALLPGVITLDFGVSGQSTVAMLADQLTQVISAFDANKKHKVLVVLEGGNHIDGGGATAIAAHDTYREYCLNARAAGALVVACSIFDRNRLPTSPAYVAARVRMREFNALMRVSWPGYASTFVDSARIQPAVFDNAENLGYWPDGVHYEPVAYSLYAKYVATAISRITI
jgi:hypothetical protein